MSTSDSDESVPPAFPLSPQEAIAFMQKMWNPLGIPIPGFGLPDATPSASEPGSIPFPNPAMMLAALDPAEIDRKIAELRIVENWLTMSVNMLQMSVKALELQKASLEAFSAARKSMQPQGGAAKSRAKPGK